MRQARDETAGFPAPGWAALPGHGATRHLRSGVPGEQGTGDAGRTGQKAEVRPILPSSRSRSLPGLALPPSTETRGPRCRVFRPA